MPDISASAVASLRSRTGVSILQCKKALEEAGGDEEKAIEILRASGEAQAVKKAERDQHEGAIFVAEDGKNAVMAVIKCETDFVARNDDFIKLGQDLVEFALAHSEEESTAKAEEVIPAAVQALGENIALGDVHRIAAESLGGYVHSNRKIGVLVGLNGGSAELAKDAAMHAAAMNPLYVNPEEVPSEEVEKEKELWTKQLAEEGKPAEIMEKIMIGKEKKFREENALLTQEFVKDPGVTVGKHLDGAEVVNYVRVAIG